MHIPICASGSPHAPLQKLDHPLTNWNSTACLNSACMKAPPVSQKPIPMQSAVKKNGNSSTSEHSYSPSFNLSLLLATACIRPIVPQELLTVCFRKYTLELISWSFILSVCCFLKFSCCKHVTVSGTSLQTYLCIVQTTGQVSCCAGESVSGLDKDLLRKLSLWY